MPKYYDSVSGQRMPLDGQERFDPARGERPEGEGRSFSDTKPILENPGNIGPTDLSDVVQPNSARLGTDASFRPGDGRMDMNEFNDPYPKQNEVQPPLPPKNPFAAPRATPYPVKSPSGAPSRNSPRKKRTSI